MSHLQLSFLLPGHPNSFRPIRLQPTPVWLKHEEVQKAYSSPCGYLGNRATAPSRALSGSDRINTLVPLLTLITMFASLDPWIWERRTEKRDIMESLNFWEESSPKRWKSMSILRQRHFEGRFLISTQTLSTGCWNCPNSLACNLCRSACHLFPDNCVQIPRRQSPPLLEKESMNISMRCLGTVFNTIQPLRSYAPPLGGWGPETRDGIWMPCRPYRKYCTKWVFTTEYCSLCL